MPTTSRLRPNCVSLFIVVLTVARHLPELSSPWPANLGSYNSVVYATSIEHNFLTHGLLALHGKPYLRSYPTIPPSVAYDSAYTNHPPLFRWITHPFILLFGWSERAFRLLPLVLTALTSWALVALGRRLFDGYAVYLPAVLFATLPMSFRYGTMANYEPAILLSNTVIHLSHLRWRSASRGRYTIVPSLVALAVWVDWAGGFSALGLLAYELLQRRSPRRLLRCVACLAAAAASAMSVIGLFAWWSGDLSAALAGLHGAAGSSVAAPAARDGAWLHAVTTFWLDGFGWAAGTLGLVGSGMILFYRRLRTGIAGATITAMMVPGVVNVWLFPRHSGSHDFFLYYLIAPVVLSATALLLVIAGTARPVGVLLACLLAVGAVASGTRQTVALAASEDHEAFVTLADALDSLAAADDLLVFTYPIQVEKFYLRHRFVDDLTRPDQIHTLEAALRLGAFGSCHATIIVPDAVRSIHPEVWTTVSRIGDARVWNSAEIAKRSPLLASTLAGGSILVSRVRGP